MSDLQISKKSHPVGSLARRVLTISLFLLVIPLFLQNLFLYRQEYRQKLNDVKQILVLLGKERSGLIDEIIEMQWKLLDLVETDPDVHAKQLHLKHLPLPPQTTGRFVSPDVSAGVLWVGKKIEGQQGIALPIPFSQLIEQISEEKDFPYPIRLALVTKEGQVVAENQPAKVQKHLLRVQLPIADMPLQLLLSIPQSMIHELHERDYYFRFATLVFFVGILGGGTVFWLTRRISKPLKHLCATMHRISEGAVHVRYFPDSMGFEINQLGQQFNETLDALLNLQQEAEKERLARQKLAQELRIGHEIQANLLPHHIPKFPGMDIAFGYLPAKEVGGDFYDLFPLEDGRFLFVIADTAGKGISACLYSLGLRTIFRSLATSTKDLAQLVLKANDLFWLDTHESGMFVTAWLAFYDPATQQLTYCSQGHPPVLLKRGSQVEELFTKGMALGVQKLDSIMTHQMTLRPGDLLFLYTDGIVEAHSPDGKMFGHKRLREFLLSQENTCTSQQLIDHLLDTIQVHSQGTSQHDDMTLLAFRYTS